MVKLVYLNKPSKSKYFYCQCRAAPTSTFNKFIFTAPTIPTVSMTSTDPTDLALYLNGINEALGFIAEKLATEKSFLGCIIAYKGSYFL